jgi:Flp pilus assembly secretin CpaC
MTLFQRRQSLRPVARVMSSILLLIAAASGAAQAAPSTFVVEIDQARVMKVPERATTLIIGNPLIADVTVQTGGILIVTGKGYGATNLLALDRDGGVLLEQMIEVQGPPGVVVVHRGVERESYSCAPDCEPRITLGDSANYFGNTIGQAAARSSQAQGLGAQAQPAQNPGSSSSSGSR